MTHIIIFLENIESSDDTIAVTSLADATLKKIILSQKCHKNVALLNFECSYPLDYDFCQKNLIGR